MDDGDFKKMVEGAIRTLPQELSQKLENVSLVISDNPSIEQIKKLKLRERGKLLLGLYEGIPKTRRGGYGIGGVLPDKITIFKIPLLAISNNLSDLMNNVRDTVIHEIAHHFGLSEDMIRKTNKK